MTWRIFFLLMLTLGFASPARAERPNVILMMSDDQGWGDFGATGNDVFQTPNIDRFAQECGSMTQFYVSPVCSPTRACLMTGRYNYRTRVIDTWLGRSMMDPDETTIAESLAAAGYATGIFGKWHLGDCYPMRPHDQGFEQALVHRGGGLAQPSEPRENERRYTDPILFQNGKQVKTKGFCTDVYFSAALKFIEASAKDKRSFFAYIPTNAPHGPYHDVPEALRKEYQQRDVKSLIVGKRPPRRVAEEVDRLERIGAMVTNIDDNVGRLLKRLDQLGLSDNTIVIYMVDNGPNTLRYVGETRRGMKSHVHEGGVRSPFWIRWPGHIKAGAQSDRIAAHIDVLPTILDACGVKRSASGKLDGRSLLPLLTGGKTAWRARTIAIQSHRGDRPKRYHHFMIRDQQHKLLHASGFGRESFDGEPKFELYDLINDPGETKNLVGSHPEVLERLRKAYDRWFDDVSSTRPNNYAPPRVVIGEEAEPRTVLTRQDWRGGSWQRDATGAWELSVPRKGTFALQVDFDPANADETLTVAMGGAQREIPVTAGQKVIQLKLEVEAGDHRLQATLGRGDVRRGVYQIEVQRVGG